MRSVPHGVKTGQERLLVFFRWIFCFYVAKASLRLLKLSLNCDKNAGIVAYMGGDSPIMTKLGRMEG
jgi:hypothetical protein